MLLYNILFPINYDCYCFNSLDIIYNIFIVILFLLYLFKNVYILLSFFCENYFRKGKGNKSGGTE